MVMVKGFLLQVSVRCREYADALIASHTMMMVTANNTIKRDMNSAKGKCIDLSNED